MADSTPLSFNYRRTLAQGDIKRFQLLHRANPDVVLPFIENSVPVLSSIVLPIVNNYIDVVTSGSSTGNIIGVDPSLSALSLAGSISAFNPYDNFYANNRFINNTNYILKSNYFINNEYYKTEVVLDRVMNEIGIISIGRDFFDYDSKLRSETFTVTSHSFAELKGSLSGDKNEVNGLVNEDITVNHKFVTSQGVFIERFIDAEFIDSVNNNTRVVYLSTGDVSTTFNFNSPFNGEVRFRLKLIRNDYEKDNTRTDFLEVSDNLNFFIT